MLNPIKAPPGYEGCCWYDDGIHEYRVSFRREGDNWWTNTYLTAGHVHLAESARLERAEQAIVHALKVRGLS